MPGVSWHFVHNDAAATLRPVRPVPLGARRGRGERVRFLPHLPVTAGNESFSTPHPRRVRSFFESITAYVAASSQWLSWQEHRWSNVGCLLG